MIIAAGDWIGDFTPGLSKHLAITRQVVGWFPPRKPELFELGRCPVFTLDGEDDHRYGFPNFACTDVKCASHVRGITLAHPHDRDANIEK